MGQPGEELKKRDVKSILVVRRWYKKKQAILNRNLLELLEVLSESNIKRAVYDCTCYYSYFSDWSSSVEKLKDGEGDYIKIILNLKKPNLKKVIAKLKKIRKIIPANIKRS